MNGTDKTLKRLVWLYFVLLLVEGALRKWITPSLSAPLLLVRDPVVIAIYVIALSRGIFPFNGFLASAAVIATLDLFASAQGVGSAFVTIYGLRSDFLHLPLVFLVPKIFTADDVRRMGRWVLWATPPMALLAMAQFRAGPASWLNAGAGGDVGAQLWVAEGRVRPSGSFSFVNGMVAFLSLSAACLLDSFLRGDTREKVLRLVVLPALVLALAVSGSRSAIIAVTIVFAVGVVACLRMGSHHARAVRAIILAYVAYLAFGMVPTFREGVDVVSGRFESGGGLQEGIIKRYFSDLAGASAAAEAAPLLGYGLGVGTNVGAAQMFGRRGFLLTEGEWGRIILESGPLLGFAFIALRIAIVLHMLRVALRSLAQGNVMALLLFGASSFTVFAGKYGQPTECGFAMLGAGLTLAAAGAPAESRQKTSSKLPQRALPEGQAPYASRLHGDSEQ